MSEFIPSSVPSEMAGGIAEPRELGQSNWTDTVLGKALAVSALIAEVTPANELMRAAVFAGALKYGGTEAAVVATSAATMALESGAGITTADLLDTDGGQAAVQRVNSRIEKMGIGRLLKTNPLTEAGLALFGGSAVVTAIKHRQHPERTRSENRRYSLRSAVGITAVTGAEALAFAEGISHPSPASIGLAVLAVGAAVGAGKATMSRLRAPEARTEAALDMTEELQELVAVTTDTIEDESVIERSIAHYENYTSDTYAQRLGLASEDMKSALQDEDTYKLVCRGAEGEELVFPFLTPTRRLYWFNNTHLKATLGADEVYYYTHPPVGLDHTEVKETISKILANNGAILYDTVTANEASRGNMAAMLGDDSADYQVRQLGTDKQVNYLSQYAGLVDVDGKPELIRRDGNIYSFYKQAVAEGVIEEDAQNGTALVDVIEGADAEKLWSIYQAPFEKLAEEHPMGAGFDKDGFLALLKDPDVTKVLNRDNGEPTTLATFIADFKHAPWLNAGYFKTQYKEAYDTDNLLIFTGIVADQSRKTPFRSLALIKLLMQVASYRESAMVVSFECSEISAKYTPKLVQFAIGRSGYGKVESMEPVSRLEYFALTKGE
jgi:hypothetical protein